jgi:hypothetical protein
LSTAAAYTLSTTIASHHIYKMKMTPSYCHREPKRLVTQLKRKKVMGYALSFAVGWWFEEFC